MRRYPLLTLLLLIIASFSLTSCGAGFSQAAALPTRAATITPPAPSPSPQQTATAITQASPTATFAVPVPTASHTVLPVLVTTDVWAAPDPNQGERLAGARWQPDGTLLYALIPEDSIRPLYWRRFDPASGTSEDVAPPRADGRALWAHLDASDPARRAKLYPEIAGLVSPSGGRAIYPWVVKRHQYDVHPLGKSWVFVVFDTGQWWLLFDRPLPGTVTQAAWLDDWHVVFDALDGEPGLYFADANRWVLTRLDPLMGLKFNQQVEWALSPGGSRLVVNGVLDGEDSAQTHLFSLDDPGAPLLLGSFEGGSGLHWTADGQAVTFWREGGLYRREIQSGVEAALVPPGAQMEGGLVQPGGSYALSPDGQNLALWDGSRLAITTLSNP